MSSSRMGVSVHYDQAVGQAFHGSIEKCRSKLELVESIDRGAEITQGEIQFVHLLLYLREKNIEQAISTFRLISSEPELVQKVLSTIGQLDQADPIHIAEIRRLADSARPRDIPAISNRNISQQVGVLLASLLILGGVSILAFDPMRVIWRSADEPTADELEVLRTNSQSLRAVSAPSPNGEVARSMPADSIGRVIISLNVLLDNGTEHVIPISAGTAFAVSVNGLMLTNRHVVESGREFLETDFSEYGFRVLSWDVTVAFSPDISAWHSARIEKSSMYLDLAVLRVDKIFEKPLLFAPTYSQGDDVTAWGYPGVTGRFLSQFNREETARSAAVLNRAIEDSQDTELSHWLAENPAGFTVVTTRGIISAFHNAEDERIVLTDAAIHPGNSGGPLLNRQGQVIGIVTYGRTLAEGVGAAVAWTSLVDELSVFPEIEIP